MQIYPVANARHHMMIFIYFISMLGLKLNHVSKKVSSTPIYPIDVIMGHSETLW